MFRVQVREVPEMRIDIVTIRFLESQVPAVKRHVGMVSRAFNKPCHPPLNRIASV